MTLLDEPRVVGPDRPATRGRRVPVWLAIVAASLPMFMATLDNLVMTSALPVVQQVVDLRTAGARMVLPDLTDTAAAVTAIRTSGLAS